MSATSDQHSRPKGELEREVRHIAGEVDGWRRDALLEAVGLLEQLESAQDGWKAAAGLSADLSAFGRALEEIAQFIEGRYQEGDTDYQAAIIARRVLNGDSFPAGSPKEES